MTSLDASTATVEATAPAAAPVTGTRRIGRNVSVLAASQAATWTLSLLWTLIVPRLIGPSGMGLLVMAMAVSGIFGVLLGQGLKVYLVREMVAVPERAGRLMGTAIVVRIALLPALFGGVWAYAHFAGLNSDERLVLFLATGTTFFMLLAEPMQAVFQATERMEYLAYGSVVDEALQAALAIALAAVGVGAAGLMGCALVVTGAMVFVNAHWARRQVRIDLRTSAAAVRSLFRDSLVYWAFGVFFMIYLWIDSAILAILCPPEVVGWYGVPTKIFTSTMVIPVIVATAWLPNLVASFERDPAGIGRAARAPIETILILSIPVAVLAAMAADPVIPLLFGPAYRNAAPVMAVLALAIPPMYLNILLNQVLVAARRQRAWTWVMAGATVVNPILNLVLIHVCDARYANGAIGAAASMVVTEVLIVGVGLKVVGYQVLDRSSVARLAKTGVAAAAMVGTIALTRRFGFVLGAAAGAAVFVGLLVLLDVPTDAERDWARGAVQRVSERVRARGGR